MSSTVRAARVAPAAGPRDMDVARALLREYEKSVNAAQCFGGFEEELAALPGDCAPPLGGILLARDPSGAAIGVVALRPLAAGVAELKRLYVRPAYRGLGIGTELVRASLRAAFDAGHRAVRLSTLPKSMPVADAMYRAMGFKKIPSYAGAACAAACYEIAL